MSRASNIERRRLKKVRLARAKAERTWSDDALLARIETDEPLPVLPRARRLASERVRILLRRAEERLAQAMGGVA
jgi:hypothetical protein